MPNLFSRIDFVFFLFNISRQLYHPDIIFIMTFIFLRMGICINSSFTDMHILNSAAEAQVKHHPGPVGVFFCVHRIFSCWIPHVSANPYLLKHSCVVSEHVGRSKFTCVCKQIIKWAFDSQDHNSFSMVKQPWPNGVQVSIHMAWSLPLACHAFDSANKIIMTYLWLQ